MRKSLFKKYLSITSLIIGICLFVMMIVMITLISNQWSDDKREILGKNSATVSMFASANTSYDYENNTYVIGDTAMRSLINVFATTSDTDIFITDMNGNRIMGHYAKSKQTNEMPVSLEIVNAAKHKSIAMQTNLSGAYDSMYYLVATPIIKEFENGTTETLGIVYCATSSTPLAHYWIRALRTFLGVCLAVFLISFAVIWLFTYKMVSPLRQMSAAAHSFGEGDFSKRITAISNDEIGELAEAMNNMATSLSDSEGTRRSFIANVSHELKTPMTTIAGFVDGILDGTISEKEQKKYLTIVSQEVKRLSRLVGTMLDLTKIDNGELKLRKGNFDLSEIILSTVLTFERNINDKNIDIRGLEDLEGIVLEGDTDMIHQVVYNLIENAVKFTDENGYIEFSMDVKENRVTTSIRNSGSGISPEEIGMIFERFYKTDKSRSKDKNGMGLGLFIVKTIIRLHGGEIHASSIENEYTTFEFWLPRKTEKEIIKEQSLSQIQDGEYKDII